jgi:hypothetical protein
VRFRCPAACCVQRGLAGPCSLAFWPGLACSPLFGPGLRVPGSHGEAWPAAACLQELLPFVQGGADRSGCGPSIVQQLAHELPSLGGWNPLGGLPPLRGSRGAGGASSSAAADAAEPEVVVETVEGLLQALLTSLTVVVPGESAEEPLQAVLTGLTMLAKAVRGKPAGVAAGVASWRASRRGRGGAGACRGGGGAGQRACEGLRRG